jgi:hypothetical protein
MKPRSSELLFEKMKEGRVYRREDLLSFSNSLDRDLQKLVQADKVEKLGSGLYYRPVVSRFGPLPPKQHEVVRAFLKTDDFLLTSLNYFNGLGVGLTQLSNEMLVYNRKRVGKFTLGGLVYNFQRPPNFPKSNETSEEYLFVDLLNNYDNILESPEQLEDALKLKASRLKKSELLRLASRYGKVRANKKLQVLLENG